MHEPLRKYVKRPCQISVVPMKHVVTVKEFKLIEVCVFKKK